ncbi:hypothetical protein ACIN8IBEIGE_160224 [Acinetobacter sp. 8I-beige]|nr:hypothetical protein ACIN8IBEIGE_160224 [Acinetobacter sp. 8I-beige]
MFKPHVFESKCNTEPTLCIRLKAITKAQIMLKQMKQRLC